MPQIPFPTSLDSANRNPSCRHASQAKQNSNTQFTTNQICRNAFPITPFPNASHIHHGNQTTPNHCAGAVVASGNSGEGERLSTVLLSNVVAGPATTVATASTLSGGDIAGPEPGMKITPSSSA